MALSLLLRNANKMKGYPCILRCTSSAFQNVGNISYLTSNTHVVQKPALTLRNQIILPPTIRNMSGGDHRIMWTVERLISLGLLGVLPLAVIMPNPFLDYTAALMMVVHFHWGLIAMAEDYVRPVIFGPSIPKIALAAVYVISSVTLGGLFYFNYSDVGLGEAVQALWMIKPSA